MDDVGVCNQALSAIGSQATIASLTEASTEAAACLVHYATTRDLLLREHRWNFARKQQALALLKAALGTPENPTNGAASAQPPSPWLYEYAYPAKCLALRYILPLTNSNPQAAAVPLTSAPQSTPSRQLGPPIPFIAAGDSDAQGNDIKVILTDQPQAVLIYTGQILDPNVWDVGMQTAMIGRLAQKLVIPCSGDKALAKLAIEAGAAAEANAASDNGNEGIDVVDMEASWIVGRGGTGNYPGVGYPLDSAFGLD